MHKEFKLFYESQYLNVNSLIMLSFIIEFPKECYNTFITDDTTRRMQVCGRFPQVKMWRVRLFLSPFVIEINLAHFPLLPCEKKNQTFLLYPPIKFYALFK